MQSFFKKPYPYNPFTQRDVLSSFFIGCFVAFFLLVFQPFGISLWKTEYRVLKIIGFGLVSFICPVIFKAILVLLIKKTKPEETWVIWKEILALLFALLFITIGNLVYAGLIGIILFSFNVFMLAFLATFLLGLFPITANIVIKHNRFLALNQKEAQHMEQEVKEYQLRTEHSVPEQKEIPVLSETEQLILISENGKDVLELTPADLLYVESADNYCEVVFLKNNAVTKHLIRASLKLLESQIQVSFILRCHRSYIVNLKQVEHIKGNAQGYKIDFKCGSNTVPVSRNYSKILFERIESLK